MRIFSLCFDDWLRCKVTNWGSEIKQYHRLQTLRNRKRDFTGSLESIPTKILSGRYGS
ncbi:hypothetical protein LguiA_032224 [Lonicera macranthoides]